jgi:hypothetical protein
MKFLSIAALSLGALLVMGSNGAQAGQKCHHHAYHCYYGHSGHYDAKADVWRDTCHGGRHHHHHGDKVMMMKMVVLDDPMMGHQPAMYKVQRGAPTHPHNSGSHMDN